jgi:hypothetical protein
MTHFLCPLLKHFTDLIRYSAPRPTLVGRVEQDKASLYYLCIQAAAFSLLGLALISFEPVQAQTQASICIPITVTTNGVAVTSCAPISATNPLPISLSGTATATLTANTTPTSGFTAGQLLMSNGTLLVPAGAALATSLTLTGAMSALSYTANSLAGVSCAAGVLTPATTVVTNGIITHC